MSYKLGFWKPVPDVAASPPRAIYEHGPEEGLLDELEALPIDTVLDELEKAFPGFDLENTPAAEFSGGSMEVFQGAQWFRFVFRGPDVGGAMAKTWQVMRGFGCVCFDPQLDTLYTAENPPDYRNPTPEQKQAMAAYAGPDTATLSHRMDVRNTRRTIIGCGLLLAAGLLFGSGVIAAIAYLLT